MTYLWDVPYCKRLQEDQLVYGICEAKYEMPWQALLLNGSLQWGYYLSIRLDRMIDWSRKLEEYVHRIVYRIRVWFAVEALEIHTVSRLLLRNEVGLTKLYPSGLEGHIAH